jgi:hypothetical protein
MMTESEFLEQEQRLEEHDRWRARVLHTKEALDEWRARKIQACKKLEEYQVELQKLLSDEPKREVPR